MGDYLIAVIMGIVEGLTEFVPVSSTGHMILTADLLGFKGDVAKTFEVVVQLGAVLAVLVLYWKRYMGILKDLVRFDFKQKNKLNAIHMLIAMLPAGILGIALYRFIKDYLFGPGPVLVGLIVGGVLMIVAEKAKRKITSETSDEITYKQALGIGLFQCLALWPGFSRSGSTMAGGLL
ncbi:UDP pyrophosphate phosphatase, partial [Paenibacillus darwinianus]